MFSGDVRLSSHRLSGRPQGISASAAGCDRGGIQAALAIPRKTLMLRELDELCYPPIAEAKAIPTGTVMLLLALARQPLEPARVDGEAFEVGRDKRDRALVTRGFATRHRLQRVLR